MFLIYILAIVIPLIIWKLFGLAGSPREILHRLAKAIGCWKSITTPISNEERRWVVIGVCLTKVLTPALRDVLATEIPKWHQVLCQPPTEIDKQVFGGHQKKLHPSTLNLNYKSINNNNAIGPPRAFDYTVRDPLSLAKLFVLPFMSKFTGFDETMDMSAILSVICEAAPFVGAAAHAKTVRSDIRNEWAHSNVKKWTDAKFNAAFQSMEALLKNVNLTPDDEQKLCDELNSWKGSQLCFGEAVDIEMLNLLRGQVDELCEAVKTWNLEKGQMNTLSSNITKIQSNLNQEICCLRMTVEEHSKEIKHITTELSRCFIKEEEKIPYVFTAPPCNNYFAGRKEEVKQLKRILEVEETLNEKKIRIAAVCGLGGIGKTSLVCEYAHQMKDFYKGGVYWFSAEDDTFLDKTVNGIALKIKAKLGSFDLTLSDTLRKIGTTDDPCLIVLDCLDQLHLSSNMMKFLSFPSQENFFGHFLVLTRRNPNRLCNDIPLFVEDVCLQLKCFPSQEAKQFLFSRTGATGDENNESVAEELCEELERLPLALEQAGACIKSLRCSLSSYLEQYKTEHLRLLSQQPGRPVSPGNESSERLAVSTTWRINMEYIKRSPNGHVAVRFMNACTFFNGNEIEEELINVGTPAVEDVAYCKRVSSPLGPRQVLKLLTDFSLFTYVEAHRSVSTHRLVQELVRESLNPESKAESFTDAVRMLSYAFSECPSPISLVSSNESNGEEQNIAISDLSNSPSQFYMWSKFCMHSHHLCRNMENLLVTLDLVWFPETAKILYECAVHLSANYKQEEAKRILNIAYRILDWLPLARYETVEENVSNNSLFPLSIPLPKSFQVLIKRCCMPPFPSLPALTETPGGLDLDDLKQNIEELRREGKKSFNENRYIEALDAYSSAIDLAQDCNSAFDPLLLTNRATVFIKLGQYEDALKDANDYITRRPDCWRGYARKALALDGLNEKVSAEIAAALAFYHKRAIFSNFSPFKKSFLDLQKRIFICDYVNELHEAIFSNRAATGVSMILVLGSKEYILNSDTLVKPWNHCILVGTKKNCSVSLKSDYNIPLLKCRLINLSFYLNKSQLRCLSGSIVKVLNCNFTSFFGELPAVATKGDFNAEQCNFTSSNDIGLLCVGSGKADVVDCSFSNNGKAGLEVSKGATLIVKSSRMCNNGWNGLQILESKTSKCVAVDCDIGHNCNAGIAMIYSKNVTLIRNSIFGNDECGIFMVNSEANVGENNVFDNDLWGIWSQSNSWCNISMNRVFRNKAGGVRVGYRAAGKEFPQSVVKQNNVYDNVGPGFVEDVNSFEVLPWALGKNEDLMKSYFTSPNSLKSARFQDNEEHNNKGSENVGKLNLSVPYCSSCRLKCKPKICKKCFTTAYCSKKCKRNHWPKHDTICKVLRKKSSYLITSMERVKYDITKQVDGRKENGPNESVRPRRKGRRFDVKVHTVITEEGSFSLVLSDRSRQLHERFDNKVIKELVKEFGVLCEQKGFEKKLFFHCLMEDNGQLRLFTNTFPKFQSW